MVVRIHYRKVYDKRKKEPKRVVIEKIEGVIEEEKLPADYLTGVPRFYRSGKDIDIFAEPVIGKVLREGLELPWSEFKELLGAMEEAGERLHEINKKHRVEKKLWEDGMTHVVEI